MFLDTVNVRAYSGVTFAIQTPVKYDAGTPDYIFGGPADTWDVGKAYVTVLTSADWPSETKYRMWYSCFDGTDFNSCYSYSADGLTFTRPNLGLVTYGGNTNNNIFCFDNVDAYGGSLTAIIYDDATDVYIALRGTKNNGGWTTCNEIFTAALPYGPWTLVKTLPTTYPAAANGIGHGMGLVKRADGSYLEYYQHWNNAAGVRSIGAYLSSTTDLAGSWSDLGIVQAGVGQNDQRHSTTVTLMDGLCLHLTDNYDDSPLSSGPLILAISRDGQTISEKDADWLPMGASGAWDDALMFKGCFLRFSDEWWIYYCGAPTNSIPYNANVGLAKIGFERIGGATGTGTVEMQAITPASGDKLYVNCDASGGSVKVEVLSATTGLPVTGYAESNFDTLTSDTYNTEATWGGLSLPTGSAIRLKFVLVAATLYAYHLDA